MCAIDEAETRDERVRRASQARREQNKADLREQILAAAGEVFLERGYEQFSMRQVAERIGYSATTIYNYFENKDDLLFAVVDQGFERFSADLQAAAESETDPRDKLDAIGEAYVRFGLENPMYYELMFMRRTEFLLARPQRGEPATHRGVSGAAAGDPGGRRGRCVAAGRRSRLQCVLLGERPRHCVDDDRDAALHQDFARRAMQALHQLL